jgi:acyl carrier protein
VSQDIDARLLRIFEQILGPVVAGEVVSKPGQGHPEWDSIAHINLVIAVEQHFRVSFTPEEAGMTTSFESLRDTLGMKVDV